VRGCRTIALGPIYRVIQESAVLYGYFNQVILGKERPINMGPVQTVEGVLAGR
jgi:hypothetical protein